MLAEGGVLLDDRVDASADGRRGECPTHGGEREIETERERYIDKERDNDRERDRGGWGGAGQRERNR